MTSDRHAFRASWHDYNEGIYFVTICTAGKRHIFGQVIDGEMVLNQRGMIVDETLRSISMHSPVVEIHNHVVMPNHIHILMQIVGTRYIASAHSSLHSQNTGALKPPMHGEATVNNHFNSRLSVIIGNFKAAVTRKLRAVDNARLAEEGRTRYIASLPVWQGRYHDHIVRDQRAYDKINSYISENPKRWDSDVFNTQCYK